MANQDWPDLPLDAWASTYATVHMWTQIIGKTRLALSPSENHWWHVALYVSTCGLRTSPIPYGPRSFEVDLDLAQHQLRVQTSEGVTRSFPLVPMAVADFYRSYIELLAGLGIELRIGTHPSEVPDGIPFPEDRVHAAYDADAARRCWRILAQSDRLLKRFRGGFKGKSSPVQFWWGDFDLALTLFSGRAAPPHPGGVPNVPDKIMQEAASHECLNLGWWPGNATMPEPAYYAYAAPEPQGYRAASMRPPQAIYKPELHQWLLPYAAVQRSSDPDASLLAFLDSAYAAVAELGGWDCEGLGRKRSG